MLHLAFILYIFQIYKRESAPKQSEQNMFWQVTGQVGFVCFNMKH